ncbi:hypothetical protein HCN44_009258 [Aphidius gifuensis]|uniref:Odorant-binding protein n=1 Tax=Aphidius gifuensis TaxID=684658 RepID=A0A834Y1Y3_APHGI|nr:uncharacterized protein LOC122858756 isoform X2 [Aphidius gifuensis]KAF7997860.1 hypothetical protein HCN44_009258 [Aphidius gifuensis]
MFYKNRSYLFGIIFFITFLPNIIICDEECMKKVEKVVLERCSGSGSRRKRNSKNYKGDLPVQRLNLDSTEILKILNRTARDNAPHTVIIVSHPLEKKQNNHSRVFEDVFFQDDDKNFDIYLSESDIRTLYETMATRIPRNMDENYIVTYFAEIAAKCCNDIEFCMKQENMVSCPDD